MTVNHTDVHIPSMKKKFSSLKTVMLSRRARKINERIRRQKTYFRASCKIRGSVAERI
jgi:hypothetical protein